MTTNIPKEQGHTLKQTMLNTLLLNLKKQCLGSKKNIKSTLNAAKTTPNQHQNCSIKPAKNSTKTAAENQHLHIIKPAPKLQQKTNIYTT